MASKPNPAKISVLVVDDQPNMRKIVAAILHGIGIRNTRFAGSAREAFESFATMPTDLVITDVILGQDSGVDLIKSLRDLERSPNPYVRIIANSAHATPTMLEDVRNAGADEFFVKPFSAKQVLLRVRAVSETPRPFIRTRAFFGPDRRRLEKEWDGVERRQDDPTPTAPGAEERVDVGVVEL